MGVGGSEARARARARLDPVAVCTGQLPMSEGTEDLTAHCIHRAKGCVRHDMTHYIRSGKWHR